MNKLKNQKNTRLWIDEKTRKKINQIKKSLKKSFEKVLKSKSKNKQKYTKIYNCPPTPLTCSSATHVFMSKTD
jgi:hypothetical protein